MEIHRAGPAQAALLGRLLQDFNDEFDTPSPSAEEFAARFTVLLGRQDVLAYIAGDEGAGFALLTLRPSPYFDGPLAQLEELYVRPDRRDQRLGTALMAAVMTELRERGCGEVHINVDEIDVDTRRFYERLGFVNIQPGTDYRMLCYLQELPRTDSPAHSPL